MYYAQSKTNSVTLLNLICVVNKISYLNVRAYSSELNSWKDNFKHDNYKFALQAQNYAISGETTTKTICFI